MGAREALSPQSPSHFSHGLFALAPLDDLLTYFWLSTLEKSRERTEYKNTWNVGFEADHAVLRQSRR